MLAVVSCNTWFKKDNYKSKAIDTIIDFSTVDVSPSFKACETLLENEKTECFRSNIRQKFTGALRSYTLMTDKTIDENLNVILFIDKQGEMSLKEIQSSQLLLETLPELSKSIKEVIVSMPKLYPATKRGIPVATEYNMPIRIRTSE